MNPVEPPCPQPSVPYAARSRTEPTHLSDVCTRGRMTIGTSWIVGPHTRFTLPWHQKITCIRANKSKSTNIQSENESVQSQPKHYTSSSGSPIPFAKIAKCPSLSGKHGESYIRHTRVFPRPFFNCNLKTFGLDLRKGREEGGAGRTGWLKRVP